MGCFLYYGILLVTALLGTVGASAGSVLDTEFYVSWAADHVKFFNGGQEPHLTLDQASGKYKRCAYFYLLRKSNYKIIAKLLVLLYLLYRLEISHRFRFCIEE
jgi:hypothetical protein